MRPHPTPGDHTSNKKLETTPWDIWGCFHTRLIFFWQNSLFLRRIFSFYIFYCKNLSLLRPTLPLWIMIYANFNLPYMKMLPHKFHCIWPIFLKKNFWSLDSVKIRPLLLPQLRPRNFDFNKPEYVLHEDALEQVSSSLVIGFPRRF